ncbi:MAG: hypothetical protein P3T54_06085 [Dehalogenimonas sp.]|uniref:MAM domain-containing protein n=1 Tax=Candidatus Dehalogenimonas loeffleri TaxID=3127115 RepID=A0ABZ2J4K5_9CHLR|nr:hypothetical protein [Dehalogenimonas sp.]
MKKSFSILNKSQRGQALISMLVFIAIGAIILAPVLNYIGTGLIVGEVFQEKTDDYYSADAGIVDAQWQIKYDRLSTIFPSPEYDQYNFNNPDWGATVDGDGGWYYPSEVGDYDGIHIASINDREVAVQVSNIWVPSNIDTPDAATAKNLAETYTLVVTGRDTGTIDTSGRKFEVSITYYPDGSNPSLETIGVWLPPGFTVVTDGSHGLYINGEEYESLTSQSQSANANGTAFVWELDTPTEFSDMPQVASNDNPIRLIVTFWYRYEVTGQENSRIAQTVGWVTTDDDDLFAWDADVHVIALTSKASSTYIDAIVIRQETRQLGESVNGDYFATGNSLLSPTSNQAFRDRFYGASGTEVAANDIPAGAKIEAVYLYWSGWIDWHGYNPYGSSDTVLSPPGIETASSWTSSAWPTWSNGSRWIISSGQFRARGGSYSESQLTLTSGVVDLSSYSSDTVYIYWNQSEGGTLEDDDRLYYAFNDGTGWSSYFEAFRNDGPPSSFSVVIPSEYLTAGFQVRFYADINATNEYMYLDNIQLVIPSIFLDSCSSLSGWIQTGSTWSVSSGRFRGVGGGTTTASYLELSGSLNLSSYAGVSLAASFDLTNVSLGSGETLILSFSGNGGTNWGGDVVVANSSSTSGFVSTLIPDAYKTNDFKMRFKITAGSSLNDYVYIDNIAISGPTLKYPTNGDPSAISHLVEETAKVNQVNFGTTGGNTQTVTADTYQVLANQYGAIDADFISTWSYMAMADITDQVNNWILDGDAASNGAATYTLGHVIAANAEDPLYSFNFYGGGTTGYPLGTPALNTSDLPYQYSYAGWSMIIIYSSPETKSRQLWLYDIATPGFTFSEAWEPSGITDPDFDGDGNGGGTISGFLVPEGIELENNSSKMTVFVLEGDSGITGDQIIVTGQDGNSQALANAASPSTNVWNSTSPGLSYPGIDIDTFYVNYPLIEPGDTSATINLPTQSDGFLLGYIIISFRSDTTTGGAISYLIR